MFFNDGEIEIGRGFIENSIGKVLGGILRR